MSRAEAATIALLCGLLRQWVSCHQPPRTWSRPALWRLISDGEHLLRGDAHVVHPSLTPDWWIVIAEDCLAAYAREAVP